MQFKAFIILILFPSFALCQSKPLVLLQQYAQQLPTEKLHLHFDKEAYLPGETIWYKAYLLGDGQPSAQSTNLYVGLYNTNGTLIQQQLNPIFGASAAGSFALPDTLKASAIYCRAFTAWMQNFEEDFLFTKTIKIFNGAFDSVTKNTTTLLTFFPEGGNIVEGLVNTIAFKATDGNGMPVNFTGLIKNKQTGQTVLNIQSKYDGMGRFDLPYEEGATYYATWQNAAGQLQNTPLPQPQKNGVLLKAVQQAGKIIYNVSGSLSSDSVHILMLQNQQPIYQKTVWLQSGSPVTETVNAKQLQPGVVQLTVFNTGWQPLAERVLFVNNKTDKPFAAITIQETNLQKRSKNLLEIIGTDTLPANMSVSITDADINPEGGTTIQSSLLLSGEVKGYIHNPAYYFSDAAAAAENLDLVMLTHGWRRYNWLAMQNGTMPVIKYAQDNYLEIRGQVDKKIMQQLPADEQLRLVVKTKDSTQQFYLLTPDATGLVQQGGNVFYDTARVYYTFKKNKTLAQQIGMSSANYSYTIPEKIGVKNYYNEEIDKYADTGKQLALIQYYNKPDKTKPFNKEKTMETVVVKSGGWRNWQNDPMLKLDEKYTSGMFRSNGQSTSFDVLHDENAWAKGDIYNYLLGRIPGGPTVRYSNLGKSFSPNPLIFVDENLQDNDFLRTISIDEIAYVKYFDHSYGRVAAELQLSPTLAIYLKKGDDLKIVRKAESDLKMVKVPGYSPIKEFYSPDYSQSNTNMGTDTRTTLLWMPYVLTDKSNNKVPITFYTADFTKRIRIVLEGMNEEGKLLRIEKIIE